MVGLPQRPFSLTIAETSHLPPTWGKAGMGVIVSCKVTDGRNVFIAGKCDSHAYTNGGIAPPSKRSVSIRSIHSGSLSR